MMVVGITFICRLITSKSGGRRWWGLVASGPSPRGPLHACSFSAWAGLGFLAAWWLVSKDWSPKRDHEAGGSHNALYHLGLEVLQGHFCHLPFIEAVIKSHLGSRGREESLYADGEW